MYPPAHTPSCNGLTAAPVLSDSLERRSPGRKAVGMAPVEASLQRWLCSPGSCRGHEHTGGLGVMMKVFSATATDSCSLLSAVVSLKTSMCTFSFPSTVMLLQSLLAAPTKCFCPFHALPQATGQSVLEVSMHLQSCVALAGLRSSVVCERL